MLILDLSIPWLHIAIILSLHQSEWQLTDHSKTAQDLIVILHSDLAAQDDR